MPPKRRSTTRWTRRKNVRAKKEASAAKETNREDAITDRATSSSETKVSGEKGGDAAPPTAKRPHDRDSPQPSSRKKARHGSVEKDPRATSSPLPLPSPIFQVAKEIKEYAVENDEATGQVQSPAVVEDLAERQLVAEHSAVLGVTQLTAYDYGYKAGFAAGVHSGRARCRSLGHLNGDCVSPSSSGASTASSESSIVTTWDDT